MRILLVCGGTGGHISPALGLAQELKKRGLSDIVFITTDNPTAKEMIAECGFNSEVLKAPKMPYGFSLRWPLFFIELMMSRSDAEEIIARINPDIAVGFGAYISGPAISVAKARSIKTVIHEQNASLGRANRLLLRKADRACFSFSHRLTAKGNKNILTGNPLRQGLLEGLSKVTRDGALSHFNFSPEKKTLLILGGSKGASAINNLLMELSETLTEREAKSIQIIHITGNKDYEAVSRSYRVNKIDHWVRDFYNRMDLAYKAADLIICRAGASTLTEAALFGIPALFIPYPWAGSHQRDNGAVAVKRGGALLLEEAGLTSDKLKDTIFGLINSKERLGEMGSAMHSLCRSDAAVRLADVVEELINAE